MLRSMLGQFREDVSGLALIEFALTFPVLLSTTLCGLEAVNLAVANMRVSEIAMQAADNAARVREKIYESDINEIFVGSGLSGAGIDFQAHGRVILSSIERNAQDGQYIRWQRCFGAKTATSSFGKQGDGVTGQSIKGMGPPGQQIAAQAGVPVMFVEVVYDYQPIVSNKLFGKKVLSYVNALNNRDRSDPAIYNTSPAATVSKCDS